MQKFAADGTEISHAILTGGKPVVTAGEAQIAGNAKAGYWGIDIDNNSGHFLNDATIEQNECLRDIAKNAFMGFGIHF